WLAPLWKRWDAGFRRLEAFYRGGLRWSLARPRNGWAVIGGITLLAVSTLFVATRFVGGEFIPSGDEGAIQLELELPSGTPLLRTAEVTAVAEQRLLARPDVEAVLTTIAGGGFLGIGGGANLATVLVRLNDDAPSTSQVLREVR